MSYWLIKCKLIRFASGIYDLLIPMNMHVHVHVHVYTLYIYLYTINILWLIYTTFLAPGYILAHMYVPNWKSRYYFEIIMMFLFVDCFSMLYVNKFKGLLYICVYINYGINRDMV